MKVLFVATVVKKHIMEFHIPYLKMFKEMGWETSVAAANDYEIPSDCFIPYCDEYFDMPFKRNPIASDNIRAYKMLKKIINDGRYDIIHCHTPVGGILTRFAAINARKHGTKVIYTAHGFHFYKGAPLKNWLLYYPAEKFCAHWTDVLITINKEDYVLACKKMKAQKVYFVPGVGVDLDRCMGDSSRRDEIRGRLGVKESDVLLVSVGELNKNKNHSSVIKALGRLNRSNIHYVIIGKGSLDDNLKRLAVMEGIEKKVHLMGFREDVPELLTAADIFVFPSYREGLSLSLMEAMATGLPAICSDIRGNRDLVTEETGILYDVNDQQQLQKSIVKLVEDSSLRKKLGVNAKRRIKAFSLEKVKGKMEKIYHATMEHT